MQKPAYWAINKIFINGRSQKRIMVVFKTPACSRILKGRRCFVCGFEYHSRGVREYNLASQLRYLNKEIVSKDIEHIDLLSSGSLLDSQTIAYTKVLGLMDEVKKIKTIRSILIEGRVEYCNFDKLQEIKSRLNGVDLEYGIGLEAYSSTVRNKILRKDLELEDYVENIKNLSKTNIGICTYILLGIPCLSLQDSFKEAINSIIRVVDLYKRYGCRGRVALFPVFIAPNTELERLYNEGKYKLMDLEKIVDILFYLHSKIDLRKYPIFIGLDDEGISRGRYPDCTDSKVLKHMLEEFNFKQDIAVFCKR